MRSDLDLLDAWRSGSMAAGETLFDRHFDALHRFFRNKVGPECEELVQRTLIACLEKRDNFEGRSSFRTWLFAIARFELLRFYRNRDRRSADPVDTDLSVHDLDPSPSVVLARAQEHTILLQALRRLPLDLQLAIELHYWEKLSSAEIGEVLEIPAGTVKSRLRRARELLQRTVRKLATDPALLESTVMGLDTWATELRDIVGGSADANRSRPNG